MAKPKKSPRNCRPSFVSVSVDGLTRDHHTGPRAKDGIMTLTIKVRENGSPLDILKVSLTPDANGQTITARIDRLDDDSPSPIFLEEYTM